VNSVEALGRRSDFVIALGGTRGARSATGSRRCRLIVDGDAGHGVGSDCRREHVERMAVIRTVAASGGLGLLVEILGGALMRVRATPAAIVAILAIAALEAIALGTLVGSRAFAIGRFREFVVAVVLVEVIALATRILFLEASPAFAQHAEIMVRILKVIFGLDPIARELCIACQALVLFEQLSGVAALAIVLAVARLAAEVPSTLSSATAPAAASLTIIDQMPTSLRE
jgi:hypothetical protein